MWHLRQNQKSDSPSIIKFINIQAYKQMKNIQTSRRNFIKIGGFTSIGLAIGFDSFAEKTALKSITPAIINLEINPFIIIDTAGNITLVNPRPDMGQGSTQAVPSLLAEELEVNLSQVKIIQSDGKGKYGNQTAGGSSSVRALWEPLRTAGAAAKEMLLQTAAKRWNCATADCYASEGKIYHRASGKAIPTENWQTRLQNWKSQKIQS